MAESGAVGAGKYALFLDQLEQDVSSARYWFARAMELDPLNAGILGSYALHLRRAGESEDRVAQAFARALDADPSSARNWSNYAAFLAETKGALDSAEDAYLHAIAADSDRARSYARFGRFLWRFRGDRDRAREAFQTAIGLDASDAYNYAMYAEFLSGLGEMSEAGLYFDRALELGPSNPWVLELAATYLQIADPRQQRTEALLRSAARRARRGRTLGALAVMAERRNDLHEAQALFREAVDAEPHVARNATNLGLYLWRRGAAAEEVAVWLQGAAVTPGAGSFEISRYATFVASVQRDRSRAHALFRKALRRPQGDASTLSDYATFLRRSGKSLAVAERYLRDAVVLRPQLASAHLSYAYLLENRGQIHEALAAFREAAVLAPRLARPLREYGLFVWRQGQGLGLAESLLDRALEAEDDPAGLAALGRFAAVVRGDWGRARQLFEEAAEHPRVSPKVLYTYAKLRFAIAGEVEEAEYSLLRAAEISTDKVAPISWYASWLGHFPQRWDEAEARFAEAMSTGGQDGDVIRRYAGFLLLRGATDQEITELLESGLRVAPNDSDLAIASAIHADRIGLPHKTVGRMYRRALRRGASGRNTFFHYGDFLARRGRYSTAASFLNRALEVEPGDASALLLGTALRLNLGDDTTAMQDLATAISAAEGTQDLLAGCFLSLVHSTDPTVRDESRKTIDELHAARVTSPPTVLDIALDWARRHRDPRLDQLLQLRDRVATTRPG